MAATSCRAPAPSSRLHLVDGLVVVGPAEQLSVELFGGAGSLVWRSTQLAFRMRSSCVRPSRAPSCSIGGPRNLGPARIRRGDTERAAPTTSVWSSSGSSSETNPTRVRSFPSSGVRGSGREAEAAHRAFREAVVHEIGDLGLQPGLDLVGLGLSQLLSVTAWSIRRRGVGNERIDDLC